MKKYTYQTATGPVTIDVDERWHEELVKADAVESSNNRKHARADHKYAPGEPLSLESLEYEGSGLADQGDGIALVELKVDLERALATLTKLQRRYFLMARVHGYTVAEIARRYNKDRKTIQEAIESADKRIKKFLGTPPFSPSPTAI